MKHQLFCKAAVCALALGLLSGCALYDSIAEYFGDKQAAKCPDVAVLVSAAVLPAYDPAQGADPTSIIYTASMDSSDLDCTSYSKLNMTKSEITINFHVTRPSGGKKAVYRVPYFIAVTINGRILDKKIYWKEVEFPEGAATAAVSEEIDDVVTKATHSRRPSDYHYVVGFQLSKDQLEYVKKTGLYAQ
jgi:hypothetical protein